MRHKVAAILSAASRGYKRLIGGDDAVGDCEPPASDASPSGDPQTGTTASRLRVLAVVSHFKWSHIDYLAALAERFDLMVAWAGEGHSGAVDRAIREGLRATPLGRIEDAGLDEVRQRLREVLDAWNPSVVHLMYYYHEGLTTLVRELVGHRAVVVFECRDPLTTLRTASPESELWRLENAALRASDGQIFVSRALRTYLEQSHGLDLGPTSIIIPHAFAQRNVAPPVTKLSASDGRVHIAIVGTADPFPDHGRYYSDIIRRLVALGLVVHTHFHDLEGVSQEPYRELAAELDDYHDHPAVPFRQGTGLSDTISRYDLMGVFHELEARWHNESATLAVCMPTKAVCGWVHGGIPVVCFPHYRGLVEQIEDLGIGFIIDRWEELVRIAADRERIARVTAVCLAERHRFTHEWNAAHIQTFFAHLLGRASP
jgi:hypothetical protein